MIEMKRPYALDEAFDYQCTLYFFIDVCMSFCRLCSQCVASDEARRPDVSLQSYCCESKSVRPCRHDRLCQVTRPETACPEPDLQEALATRLSTPLVSHLQQPLHAEASNNTSQQHSNHDPHTAQVHRTSLSVALPSREQCVVGDNTSKVAETRYQC